MALIEGVDHQEAPQRAEHLAEQVRFAHQHEGRLERHLDSGGEACLPLAGALRQYRSAFITNCEEVVLQDLLENFGQDTGRRSCQDTAHRVSCRIVDRVRACHMHKVVVRCGHLGIVCSYVTEVCMQQEGQCVAFPQSRFSGSRRIHASLLLHNTSLPCVLLHTVN